MPSRGPIRLALGLGDQELEQRLRPALDADLELAIAVHCLAADQVLQAVEGRAVDTVVLAAGLHRLTESLLRDLERTRVPVVLLAADDDPLALSAGPRAVLPLDVDPSTLRQAITAVACGERWAVRPRQGPTAQSRPDAAVEPTGQDATDADLGVIAVAGGTGSPGRTTLAINLAVALGAIVPTVLVDVDCSSPSVSAYLNRDPSRNVCTLAHAVRDDPHGWQYGLQEELQPLHARSPYGRLLCGLPRRETRASLTPAVMEQLIFQLRRIYRYVILDVGAELLGTDAAPTGHRAALAHAQHVLLVSGSDLVSVWRGRIALGQLQEQLGIDPKNISLVLNWYDRRYHHERGEIEWHFGVAAAQVVPRDSAGLERAVAEQTPVVLNGRSAAGRAILDLAGRIHQRRIRVADLHADGERRKGWRTAVASSVGGVARWSGWS